MPLRRLLPLVGALIFLLSACRVDVRIDVTADDTGAGNIAVTVDLDAEADAKMQKAFRAQTLTMVSFLFTVNALMVSLVTWLR